MLIYNTLHIYFSVYFSQKLPFLYSKIIDQDRMLSVIRVYHN